MSPPRALALAAVVTVLAASTSCGREGSGAAERSVTVLAASSLAAVMPDLIDAFAARRPGFAVRARFGGSTSLARQVVDGAPADVLITADRTSMEHAGAAVERSELFARNRLAVAVRAGNPAGITGLVDLARGNLRVVVCAPQVPCGRLAAALLERAGLQLRPASLEQDVRAVVAKVSLGEADAGIVYATDVQPGTRGVEGVEIDEAGAPDLHAVYLAAVVASSGRRDGARAFLTFLQSAEARRILAGHGFARP